jgi:hypothetical protein
VPVSSPSYFPPAFAGGSVIGVTAGNGATGVRNFLAGLNAGKFTQPVNDLIVVGDSAMSAGTTGAPVTDAALAGTIVVGSQAVQAATVGNATFGGANYGNVVVGFNAAQSVVNLSGAVIIGGNAAKTYAGSTPANNSINGSVIVGPGAMENAQFSGGVTSQCSGAVIIGAQAGQGRASPNNLGVIASSVVIGAQAAQFYGNSGGGGGNIGSSVIIGFQAAQNIAQSSNAASQVIIGAGAGNGMTGGPQKNVLVGANISSNTANMQSTTVIGSNATCVADQTVVIGASAFAGGMTAGQTNGVFIGNGCGGNNPVAGSNQLIIETSPAGGALIVGNFANGTLVLGNSVGGTNRDQTGTSTIKIVNGVKGGANPVGGGYFYVTGGFLHWVDSAGVDTQLSATAAGQLAANALVAYSNNAGAQAATITNGPTAGNPTKWIPINDAGTIRNIPAW